MLRDVVAKSRVVKTCPLESRAGCEIIPVCFFEPQRDSRTARSTCTGAWWRTCTSETDDGQVVRIRMDRLTVRNAREWGEVWLGMEQWGMLGLDGF